MRATPVAPLLLIVAEIDTGALLQRDRGQGAGMIRLVARGNQPIDGQVVTARRQNGASGASTSAADRAVDGC